MLDKFTHLRFGIIMKYLEKESKTLEFKETALDYSKIIKTVIAFANTRGGELIIGVQDKTCTIKGLSDSQIMKYSEEIPRAIYEAISPSLIPNCYEKNIDGKIVFIIKVFSGQAKPYYLKKEGIPAGIYIRVGSNAMRAKEHIVEDLLRQGQNKFHEIELLEKLSIDSLDKISLKSFLGTVSESLLIGNKIMFSDSMHNLKLTIAGTLMFAGQPDKYITEAYTICSKFKGVSGRDIESTKEIFGSIPEQISQTNDWIISYLKRDYKLKKTRLVPSKMLLPEAVVRELVTNAVAHKRYDISAPVKVALYDDHLEVYNPGNFIGMVDESNIGTGISQYRNPAICRMLRKMGFMEKQGTGIKMIFEECNKIGLAKPQFLEGADYVKVVADFKRSKSEMISDIDKILDYLKIYKDISSRQCAKLLGVSKPSALKKISELIDKGLVGSHGNSRARVYRLQLTTD